MISQSRSGWRIGLLLALLVLLSRLPFITDDFGIDPDAWRVFNTARELATAGKYIPSRSPGYPLPEIGYAGLYATGMRSGLIWNTVTALFSAVAASALLGILRKIKAPYPVLGALAFAMTPIVYIHSTDPMDYLWALTFILLCTLGLLAKRSVLAAVSLGLAVGCRPTSALFGIVVAIILLQQDAGRSGVMRVTRFALISMAVSAVLFSLPVVVHGLDVLTFFEGPVSLRQALLRASVGTFGHIGALGILSAAAALILMVVRFPSEVLQRVWSRPLVFPSLVWILIVIALYLRLPHEAGYLIPAIPFAIILFASLLPRPLTAVVFGCLIISPFVVSSRSVLKGPIFQQQSQREKKVCLAQTAISYAKTLSPNDYLVLGYMLPVAEAMASATSEKRPNLVYGVRDKSSSGYITHNGDTIPLEAQFHVLAEVSGYLQRIQRFPPDNWTLTQPADCL